MYNEELKNKYINQYTTNQSTRNVCRAVFNAFEESEKVWGADLCTRSDEELQPIIDKIMGFRERSKWMRLIILKDYVKWCIVNNVDGACDGMLHITQVGLEKVRIQTVPNPRKLQEYLNAICHPEEMKTTDNIYRCYYWLAYAGMDEEDIFNVKISDVNFDDMTVNYPRKATQVPIYREAIKAFKNCVELDRFLYLHPNYDNDDTWKERVEGDTLIRGVGKPITLLSMRSGLSRRSKKMEDYTPLRLSYYRVWISGIFYRMREDEINSSADVDFGDIVADLMEGKTYKLDTGRNTMAAKQRQLERDYEIDYQRWKLAWKL